MIIIIKIKQQHRVKIMCNNGINEEMSMQSTQEYSYLVFKVWRRVFTELLRTLCYTKTHSTTDDTLLAMARILANKSRCTCSGSLKPACHEPVQAAGLVFLPLMCVTTQR